MLAGLGCSFQQAAWRDPMTGPHHERWGPVLAFRSGGSGCPAASMTRGLRPAPCGLRYARPRSGCWAQTRWGAVTALCGGESRCESDKLPLGLRTAPCALRYADPRPGFWAQTRFVVVTAL